MKPCQECRERGAVECSCPCLVCGAYAGGESSLHGAVCPVAQDIEAEDREKSELLAAALIKTEIAKTSR